MTTVHPPHLRHGHHHQVKAGNRENSWNEILQNFYNNVTTPSPPPRPLNFSVFELNEIQVLSINGTTESSPHQTPIDNPMLILLNQSTIILELENENVTALLPNGTSDASNGTSNSLNVALLYSRVIPPMLFFCALGILVNLVIVISARWCRKPMSPTLYFSISLALADAYASLILGTGLLINSYLPKVMDIPTSACFSLSVEGFRLGGILVIVTHLLALAINHWIGIIRPLHYAATMTRRNAWTIIILSWSCPIFIIFAYFTSQQGEGFLSEKCLNWQFLERKTFRIAFSIFFFVPLFIMSVIYIHIFFIVRTHTNERLRYQSSQQFRRNVKAVVTTVLILGTYILGWMPATLYNIIVCRDCAVNINDVSLGVRYAFGIAVNVLVILKALVDPIIYAARMADIKSALNKMQIELCGKSCGTCTPPQSTSPNRMERGSYRFERSQNETKSLRMSSFGSASSTRRTLTTLNSHSPAADSRRRVHSGSSYRECPTKLPNGIHNANKYEMTEFNQ